MAFIKFIDLPIKLMEGDKLHDKRTKLSKILCLKIQKSKIIKVMVKIVMKAFVDN